LVKSWKKDIHVTFRCGERAAGADGEICFSGVSRTLLVHSRVYCTLIDAMAEYPWSLQAEPVFEEQELYADD
jgi:hypothetical protein